MEKDLTVENIRRMNYTDFISLIKEENRPPGGKKTIQEILLNSFIKKEDKVLEVGCTNGFTSLEIARILGCDVLGIDINKNSLLNAKKRVRKEKVHFQYGDACKIPFRDESFDLVICSNATSFMGRKTEAIKEYIRVLKPWKFIAMTPMYYIKEPPIKIVKSVSYIIGVNIDIRSKKDWLDIIKKAELEVYYVSDYIFRTRTRKEINHFVEKSLDKDYIKGMPLEIIKEIKERWFNILCVFNENLKYVGYSVILLRKRIEPEEAELFEDVHLLNKEINK